MQALAELVRCGKIKYAGVSNFSASQVALNWLIHFNGDVVVVIPGARI